ncbi:MAG TPA: hypothetical protein VKA73_01510 [Rubrobacter sp.]|nr:hypothetical protein [Rubrobacter sp.]
MSEPMHCYRHPKRETRVSCATCGRPICTECMRQTEVGIKCPDDARLPRGARAGVMKRNQMIKTLLAGVGIAAAGVPVVAYVLLNLGIFGFITWAIHAAAGYGAGTLIYRAGGRNGGLLAIAVAVIATAIPFVLVLTPGLLEGALSPARLIPMAITVIAAGFANRQL